MNHDTNAMLCMGCNRADINPMRHGETDLLENCTQLYPSLSGDNSRHPCLDYRKWAAWHTATAITCASTNLPEPTDAMQGLTNVCIILACLHHQLCKVLTGLPLPIPMLDSSTWVATAMNANLIADWHPILCTELQHGPLNA